MKSCMDVQEFTAATITLFFKAVDEMGICLPGIEKHLKCWVDHFRQWKGRRVAGFDTPEHLAIKLLADSFSFMSFVDLDEDSVVLDLGSGNGWPGLAFKMAYPGVKLDLLDSRLGSCDFMKRFVDKCGFDNVNVLHLRAEEASTAKEYGEGYSVVVSRAMASFSNVLELSAPFVKPGGKAVLWLGPGQKQKIGEARKFCSNLGLSPGECYKYTLPLQMGNRCLALFNKTHSPAPGFPRKYSAVKKRPLF